MVAALQPLVAAHAALTYLGHPVSVSEGSAALCSLRAPDKYTDNEDSGAIIDLGPSCGVVLAVADGLGGQPEGDRASRLAIEALTKELNNIESNEDNLRAAIVNSFERANRDVSALGSGAGTTLTVLAVREGYVRHFHVGDSVALVTGQRGKIKLETIAHSPVGYALASGLLNEEEALAHEERHIISNIIGSKEMHVEVGPRYRLAPRDTAVIASDGLIDNLRTSEVIEIARKGPIAKACMTFAEKAQKRMANQTSQQPSHPDDLTFIVFRPSALKT